VAPPTFDIVYPVIPTSPSVQDRDTECVEAGVAVRFGREAEAAEVGMGTHEVDFKT
jgi:hypothetical protein